MSRTIRATVIAGVACTESDFLRETGSIWKCTQGHSDEGPFCRHDGTPVSERKTKEPVTEAFRHVAENHGLPGDRYDNILLSMMLDPYVDEDLEDNDVGLYSGERLQGEDNHRQTENLILGLPIAMVMLYDEQQDGPLTIQITDVQREEIRNEADRHGLPSSRPIQTFLVLSYS